MIRVNALVIRMREVYRAMRFFMSDRVYRRTIRPGRRNGTAENRVDYVATVSVILGQRWWQIPGQVLVEISCLGLSLQEVFKREATICEVPVRFVVVAMTLFVSVIGVGPHRWRCLEEWFVFYIP